MPGTPYTDHHFEAFLIAQTTLALLLSGALWARPLRPWLASLAFLGALWLAAMSPMLADLVTSFSAAKPKPELVPHALRVSAALASLALVVARPRWPALVAIAGEVALWRACDYFKASDIELSALHVAWCAALLGLATRAHDREQWRGQPARAAATTPPLTSRQAMSFAKHDAWLFIAATALALVVCNVVLERTMTSDDEWAYTYQALVFGHAKAYGPVPPGNCEIPFRMFWVFYYQGRAFSQYTPGWPLVLAPFARLGIPWLAAPVTHGMLAVGVARLARRAYAEARAAATRRELAVAGVVAALVATTGASPLLYAGSRYPHTFVMALFAWAVNAACAVADARDRRAQWTWGVALGLTTAFIASTRPADGATLGIGIFVYFVYALVRRRVGWRAFVGTAVAFSVVAVLTLVILRLQIGVWFKTGYSLAHLYYDWADPHFSLPRPEDWKYPVAFETGQFMYWPCSAALAFAGAWFLGARRIALMLALSSAAALALIIAIEFGRIHDFGYGPRYQSVFVTPFAVAQSMFLTPIIVAARKRTGIASALRAGGPATVVLVALVTATVRIGPLVYSAMYADERSENGIYRATRAAKLKNAVVTIGWNATGLNPPDVTRNDPTDPNPDVIYLGELSAEETRCLRGIYPDRAFYRATGKPDVTLTPY
jgi:hypothetical protein